MIYNLVCDIIIKKESKRVWGLIVTHHPKRYRFGDRIDIKGKEKIEEVLGFWPISLKKLLRLIKLCNTATSLVLVLSEPSTVVLNQSRAVNA